MAASATGRRAVVSVTSPSGSETAMIDQKRSGGFSA